MKRSFCKPSFAVILVRYVASFIVLTFTAVIWFWNCIIVVSLNRLSLVHHLWRCYFHAVMHLLCCLSFPLKWSEDTQLDRKWMNIPSTVEANCKGSQGDWIWGRLTYLYFLGYSHIMSSEILDWMTKSTQSRQQAPIKRITMRSFNLIFLSGSLVRQLDEICPVSSLGLFVIWRQVNEDADRVTVGCW